MRGLEMKVCKGEEVVRLMAKAPPSQEQLRLSRLRRRLLRSRREDHQSTPDEE